MATLAHKHSEHRDVMDIMRDDNVEGERENRKRKRRAENKMLEAKLEELKLLKLRFQEHHSKIDLKNHESKLQSLMNKSKYTVNQTSFRRLENLQREYDRQNQALDQEIIELKARLDQFKGLDSALLNEYRRLKDELDCQNLLIDLEGGNVDKLLLL